MAKIQRYATLLPSAAGLRPPRDALKAKLKAIRDERAPTRFFFFYVVIDIASSKSARMRCQQQCLRARRCFTAEICFDAIQRAVSLPAALRSAV
jgi:hypothetical protein